MSQQKFRRKAYVLGKEHTLKVIKYLNDNGWSKSSIVAKKCGLHIATASSYLEELNEIGLVDKREGWGKTGKVMEYRLKDPKIELSIDVSQVPKRTSDMEIVVNFYRRLFNSVLESTRVLIGFTPKGMDKIPPTVKFDETTKRDFIDSLRELIEYNENKIGLESTSKLIHRAGKELVNEYRSDIERMGLLDDIPKRYTEGLEVN